MSKFEIMERAEGLDERQTRLAAVFVESMGEGECLGVKETGLALAFIKGLHGSR